MSPETHDGTTHYEIRVRGRLGSGWAAWFDGMQLSEPGDGTTVLVGPIVDQAALHAALQRLRDVGLTLLAVAQIPPPTQDTCPATHDTGSTT
ncbi:MAG TPA: hypothetical protein VFR07_04545 [Mycobacteriales bacterium]|jgi:hypothetical protein|nr:hypothetical protein [Mycobacteriales bacterium]